MAGSEDELPTLRSSDPPPAPDDETTLWLVSFADDDDRELRRPQIAEAITRGELDAESIVWREGMADWLPIGGVASLAQLLPTTGETRDAPSVMTGGFLGTGMKTGAKRPLPTAPRPKRTSEPPKLPPRRARRSNPPPVPQRRSARKSVPPVHPAARALEPSDEEPISLDPESLASDSIRPVGDQSPTIPQAEALSAGTFAIGAQTDDDAPPSSGTPSLNALAAVSEEGGSRYDEEIMNIGGTSEGALGLLAPPTIDLSELQGDDATTPPIAPLDDDDDSFAPTTPRSKGSDASRKTEPGRTRPPVSAVPKKSDEKSQPSILLWLMAGAVVFGAIWAFARSGDSKAPEPTPVETQAANQPAPEPEPPVAETEPEVTEPEPSTVATTAPEEPAEAPTPNKQVNGVPRAAIEHAVQAPVERSAPEPASIATPAKPTPAPSATATAEPEKKPVALAGPFDKAAAAAALQGAAGQASSCRQEGDPSGRALVRVTFAESGRAVRAVVEGPPFAGTRTGGCIASVMRRATVPPFAGDRLTVSKTVVIQ